MKRYSALLAVALTFAITGWYTYHQANARSPGHAPMIGHMVFFTLKDSNAAGRQKLVEACKKYLDKHEGTVYFSAGAIADEFKREVNDRDWDVALHLVFKDRAAHDKYQDHPRHIEFINENKDLWKKVRVFDSSIEP